MLKRAGETYPLISQLVAQLSVKEGTRRECGCEPGPQILNDLQQKKSLNDKWLSCWVMGKTRQTICFPQKIWWRRTYKEDWRWSFLIATVFLQLQSLQKDYMHYMLLNQEQMFWSYWKTDILMFLIYSYFTLSKSKECLLKYDKNSYTNIVTIWTVLGNTVSRNVLLCNYRLWCNFPFIRKWKN